MSNKNLRLPVTASIGPGAEQQKTIIQHWDTAGDVERSLEKRGFKTHSQPTFACPELTADILTTTDTRHYTETYAHLLAWFNFASEKLAQVQSNILQFKNMRDILLAEGRKVVKTQLDVTGKKKMSQKEFDDHMLLNAEYQEVIFQLQQSQQSELILGTRVEGIERSLRLISRQIEIRKLDIEQTRTSSAIANRRPGSYNSRFAAPDPESDPEPDVDPDYSTDMEPSGP